MWHLHSRPMQYRGNSRCSTNGSTESRTTWFQLHSVNTCRWAKLLFNHGKLPRPILCSLKRNPNAFIMRCTHRYKFSGTPVQDPLAFLNIYVWKSPWPCDLCLLNMKRDQCLRHGAWPCKNFRCASRPKQATKILWWLMVGVSIAQAIGQFHMLQTTWLTCGGHGFYMVSATRFYQEFQFPGQAIFKLCFRQKK